MLCLWNCLYQTFAAPCFGTLALMVEFLFVKLTLKYQLSFIHRYIWMKLRECASLCVYVCMHLLFPGIYRYMWFLLARNDMLLTCMYSRFHEIYPRLFFVVFILILLVPYDLVIHIYSTFTNRKQTYQLKLSTHTADTVISTMGYI